MRVVLTEAVPTLGKAGDVKRVADGYARNYLIPKGLALPATEGALKQVAFIKKAESRKEARHVSEAQAIANRLQAQTYTFKARAGEGDKLYGSITSADIAEALSQAIGQEIDKRKIALEHPLRELGEHTVPVKLHGDVVCEVAVVVEREE